MNDQSALLEMVLANPSDDTTRLVLADLLRESEDAEDQARGRFLWAGVTAARFRGVELIEDPIYYSAQQEMWVIASAGHPVRWLGKLGIGSEPLREGTWGWDSVHDRVTVRVDHASAVFTRGMLATVNLMLTEWYQVAALVLTGAPLETVAISDVPGLSFTFSQRRTGWTLSARLKVPSHRFPLSGGGPIPTSYSPSPVLVESDADWTVEENFSSRPALLGEARSVSESLVRDLREVAGTRWPRPPVSRQSHS